MAGTLEFAHMRLLITGGAGFIGSHFVRSVLSGSYPSLADADVTVLDNLTYAGNMQNLAPVAESARLTFVRGDIVDPDVVSDVMAGHDAVVHFAAESHVDRSIAGAAHFVATNVVGTQTLLGPLDVTGSPSSCMCRPTRSTARSRPGPGRRRCCSSPTRRTAHPRRAVT
jgi:dTDP-D-glucose 4,6-dehydratase